jgi:putative transposase
MRARAGLPPFREQAIMGEMRRRIAEANASMRLRDVFRIVHFSIQDNHVHMIVEASDERGLARGVQGLAIRLARRVNALLGIRGTFWGERFHSRELAWPRAVRNAIVYVLMNAKKHGFRVDVDPCSSAPWFDGFSERAPRDGPSPIREAATWLGSTGWRKRGLVRLEERPRAPC